MFARFIKLFLPVAGASLVALSAQALPQVEELPDPSLPDIAVVQFIPGKGSIIIYNPVLCFQAGPALCEFYRYHEYGHIELRHNERHDLSAEEKEREADRWAAQHAPLPSVMAAYRFFAGGGGATPIHGESHVRAARMLARSEDDAFSAVTATDRSAELSSRRLDERSSLQHQFPLTFGAGAL